MDDKRLQEEFPKINDDFTDSGMIVNEFGLMTT